MGMFLAKNLYDLFEIREGNKKYHYNKTQNYKDWESPHFTAYCQFWEEGIWTCQAHCNPFVKSPQCRLENTCLLSVNLWSFVKQGVKPFWMDILYVKVIVELLANKAVISLYM